MITWYNDDRILTGYKDNIIHRMITLLYIDLIPWYHYHIRTWKVTHSLTHFQVCFTVPLVGSVDTLLFFLDISRYFQLNESKIF